MNITTTRKMEAPLYGMTVAQLKEFLEGLDNTAKVTISVYQGDQRDPGYITLSATAKGM